MNALSPWAIAAGNTFMETGIAFLYERKAGPVSFKVHLSDDSLWILADNDQGGRLAFRAAYSPAGGMELDKIADQHGEVVFDVESFIGPIDVKIRIEPGDEPILRYTTTLKPATDLFVPFWPRDIVIPGKNGKPENTAGKIHVSQEGTRSGLIYFSMTRPKAGSVMYLQNLTALGDYNEQTETSSGGVVGGQWPEIGFSLPAAIEKPLKAHKEVVVSDALVIFSPTVPDDEPGLMEQYLDLQARLYLHLPRPETSYHDWPDILDKGLHDLRDNPGCWSQVKGNHYFNAYVSDYDTPPEIMVQLAVMLPLIDYADWSKKNIDIIETIRKGLSPFYDEKLKVIKRWHPDVADKLNGEEEHKKPDIMDSWYLHHPLLNLSRLALRGEKQAAKLFLDSLDYTINVAHHFDYKWPVFYRMETLEVVKPETEPGKGGEKDVPGIYTHIMLQAYELTGEKRFLREAERAAKSLQGLGFELFYQANNTTFTAGALLRLYKITKNKMYRELSYLCLANVFKNVQLWDCNYGYGKHFPSFFAVFPLSNAPYTAVYEEVEVFAAFHDYLSHAEGVDILPSVSLLMAEYIRYLVYRAVYYYPPMLPKEMLSEDVKTGEVDPQLWIALEDMQDGWAKCGQVGQEVYGAGNAFGVLPRHYIRIPEEDFMVFLDYPKGKVTLRKGEMRFKVLGDARLQCKLRIIPSGNKKLPEFTVTSERQGKIIGRAEKACEEFAISGNQEIKINWK
jgi:hypothetical protein